MPPKTEAQALAKRRRLSVLDNGAPSEKIPRFNSNRSLPALSSDPAANGWTPLQGASQANDDVIDISSDSDSEPFVPRLDTSPVSPFGFPLFFQPHRSPRVPQQTAQVAGSSEVLDLVSDTETEQLPASSEAPPTRKMREATLPRPLKKCRILLDIYTGEGEDAGAEFAEQLRALGADVIRTPRRDLAAPGKLTHIVFKHGRDATLRLFELSDVKPHLVSVLWAEACHLTQARADEDRFPVGTDSAIPLKSYSKA
ncbi:hypothetical protein FRC09_012580, partial [Ceratobasidium sp. 395]